MIVTGLVCPYIEFTKYKILFLGFCFAIRFMIMHFLKGTLSLTTAQLPTPYPNRQHLPGRFRASNTSSISTFASGCELIYAKGSTRSEDPPILSQYSNRVQNLTSVFCLHRVRNSLQYLRDGACTVLYCEELCIGETHICL